jgi:hypothetical protein
MECPVCKKPCDPGDQFCRNCGASLAEEQPQGRFRPLFQKAEDPASAWDNYARPFFTAALMFCLGLMALAGIVYGIQYLLGGK